MPDARVCAFLLAAILPGLPSGFAGTYRISFKDQLKLPRDIRLPGNAASRTVRFTCESAWKPAAGSALHLFIEHSPALDPDRSFLSVSLNYGILRSVRLDDQNQQLAEVTIPLPAGQLQLENELLLSVEQYAARGARDEGIWSAVSTRSYIVIEHAAGRSKLDLALLPAPLLDPYSYRTKALSLLLPERAGTETLEAMALVVANACNRISPETAPLQVARSVQSAEHPLVIVGTPSEQPQLRALQGVWGRGAWGKSEGLAGLTTREDGLPILCVTGGSPAGVLKAAQSLFGGRGDLAGSIVRIEQTASPKAKRWRAWKGFMPPASRFTLEDLGWKELKISSQNDFTLDLPLRATPDARFLDYAPQIVLQFRLEPAVSGIDCRLEVQLNHSLLGEYAVRNIAKGSRVAVAMTVPARLLRSENRLRIALRGPLPQTGQPVAYLLPNSHFYLPRDYESELPDLGLLRFHLYPFSLTPDLADTIVILPRAVTPAHVAALAELASALGRMSPSERLAFRVRRVGEITEREKTTSHFIFLYAAGWDDAPERMFGSWPRPARPPFIQEVASPWNSSRYVLAVGAESAGSLPGLVRQIFSAGTLEQLKGDTAALGGRQLACSNTARKQKFQEYSYFTHLEAWLRANWLALPAILTGVSGVLFVGLRLALAHYKNTGR